MISTEPNNLEEAKTIINLKNNVISKMRNHIANTTHTSGPKESIIANAHDNNMIQYLKYEISRLENKFMLTQSQLNVEKARAEQLKEVMLESENNVANLSSGVG